MFCHTLVSMANVIIRWSRGEELERVHHGFKTLHGPNGPNGIDGMHISISASKEEKRAHFNRMWYTSVVLQAESDHNFVFRDFLLGGQDPQMMHGSLETANYAITYNVQDSSLKTTTFSVIVHIPC